MSDIHFTDQILIVGAGVIGLSIAWELAGLGYSVVVADRSQPGSGATRAAGGMLGLTAEVKFDEQDMLELEKQSLLMFPEYVAALKKDSGINPDYRSKATLVLARDRDDAEALQRSFDYQKSVGLPAQWLDEDEIELNFPSLRGIPRAVRCPNDHCVDPRRMTDALVAACKVRDVTFVDDVSASSLITDEGRCKGVETDDGRRIFADQTVIAAGAWSSQIAGIPEFNKPTLRPVRGQMIAIDTGSDHLIDRVLRTPAVYIIPRQNGRLLIGSTMEEKGFSEEVTAGAVRTLLREAWRILPGIDEHPIESLFSGFRPVSIDDRPLLGPSLVDDLFLATGHGRHGILLAPVSGQIMACHIAHPQWTQQTYPAFDPRRFSR